jgi:diguanylate cyclase (GGDEF)-like protein
VGVLFITNVTIPNEKANIMTQEVICAVEAAKQPIISVGVQLIRDPRTGLYSRAFMEEFLGLELSRARRQWYPIGVVLLRAPRPPQNNGTSESVLQTILQVAATFLGANVRQSDVACRYSELEFALVLPRVTTDIAHQRAAELARGLHELRVVNNEKVIGCPEFAYRVASFPQHGVTVREIIRAVESPPLLGDGN